MELETTAKQRLEELDQLYERLYEDRANGQISERNFTRLSAKYEQEQAELEQQIRDSEKVMQNAQTEYRNARQFVDIIRPYAEIQELDAHLKDLAADMGEFQRNVGNYAIAGKSLRTELKELTMQMAQMLADGVDPTSEAFLQVAERAGALKDAMEDAKDTIKDYSNDTQGLTQGISVLQTPLTAYEICARLAKAGLPGKSREA